LLACAARFLCCATEKPPDGVSELLALRLPLRYTRDAANSGHQGF
jgi:hypothetical protein